MKKTNRKNNTNLNIDWSGINGHFTIETIHSKNPQYTAVITLRTHVKDAETNGVIAELGTIHNGKGRPKKAYALTPVSSNVIENARNAGINLHEQYNTVAVVNVSVADNDSAVESESDITEQTQARVNA